MSFKWPDTILFEGREIWCSMKCPNFAEYMLPPAYMNRKIYISKNEMLQHTK